MTVQDAIHWVDNHLRIIKKQARTFAQYTPYDPDDYIQNAYEAAIIASATIRDDDDFEGYFWTIFRRIASSITPNPSSTTSFSCSSSPPRAFCQEMTEEVKNELVFISEHEEKTNPPIEKIFLSISNFLTTREKQVWRNVLEIGGGRDLINEVASKEDCSPQNIRNTINRSLKKIRKIRINENIFSKLL